MDINNEIKNNCTLVVSSCDDYDDLWEPFFVILKKRWPGLNMPIVLNTESKKYFHQGLDITTFCFYGKDEKPTWGERLIKTLSNINTKYILFMLDDFFLHGNVDNERFQQCYRWMEENNKITVFTFFELNGKNRPSDKYWGFEKEPLITPYKNNCQIALWRRTNLIKCLRKNESPWEWETYGTLRSYRDFYHEYYYINPEMGYIFPYNFRKADINFGGLVIYRGKWFKSVAAPLIEECGLDIDFNKRGIVDEEEFVRIHKRRMDLLSNNMVYRMYGRFRRCISIIKHIKHLV